MKEGESVSTEEQRKNRRERAIRKKEWHATLDKWAEFAAYMVYLKRQEKMKERR